MQYYSGIVKFHFTIMSSAGYVNVIFICHMHCVGSLYDLATSSFGCETLQMVKALVHKLPFIEAYFICTSDRDFSESPGRPMVGFTYREVKTGNPWPLF